MKAPERCLAALTAAVLLLIFGSSVNATPDEQPDVQLIDQPKSWQPLVADLLQTTPGAPDLIGQFYRASDGSERYDEWSSDGTHLLTIVSVGTAWQYACNLTVNVCQRRTTESIRPVLQWRVTTAGLVKSSQMIEGFALYEYTDPAGVKHLKAPALNFASVRTDDPRTGSQRTLSNIRLIEPDATLFLPPVGPRIVDEPQN